MRIAQINMLHFGSTGRIMQSLAEHLREAGHTVKTFSPRVYQRYSVMEEQEIVSHSYFGLRKENMMHLLVDRLSSINSCFSFFGTRQLLKMLEQFQPDVIHLHNLHNYTFCLPHLFRYIKRRKIKVVWTLHDCWVMTGRCWHFAMKKCDKWKTGCGNCPQIKEYPRACIDLTHIMWRLKKKWFTGVEDLTLVTPSNWLAGLVKESYMGGYPVKVIHNGIDLSIFKPVESDFRQRYHCEEKKILLGVAFGWGVKKGLDVFIDLAGMLPEEYQIVLVGTDSEIDKTLPDNIISIHRTQDQQELAQIYTVADVFVNPTKEEVFGLVNIEALACGTPVITFRTGGSPECIDETCGSVVPYDDVDTLEREIVRICSAKPYSPEACMRRAQQFDMYARFSEYVGLYDDK